MTTYLETPLDLIYPVGHQVGTTDWMKVTREQVNPTLTLVPVASAIVVHP